MTKLIGIDELSPATAKVLYMIQKEQRPWRSRGITPEQMAIAYDMLSAGEPIDRTAHALEVAPTTLRRCIRKWEEFAYEYRLSRQEKAALKPKLPKRPPGRPKGSRDSYPRNGPPLPKTFDELPDDAFIHPEEM